MSIVRNCHHHRDAGLPNKMVQQYSTVDLVWSRQGQTRQIVSVGDKKNLLAKGDDKLYEFQYLLSILPTHGVGCNAAILNLATYYYFLAFWEAVMVEEIRQD